MDDNIPTPEVFYTATPGYSAPYHTPGRLDPDSKYGQALSKEHALVAKEVEENWSGRGQHVEFQPDEIIPLEVEKAIGHSATALVESVLCRRIRLARKSIRVNRRAKLEDLVKEVAYLQRLRHQHVVQLVGSYLQQNLFSILMYPVATGDLAKYLDQWSAIRRGPISSRKIYMTNDLPQFFWCLASSLDYIHGQGIRHMDIKPSNILVHERRDIGGRPKRSIYLTDFGISKAFTVDEGSQTDGPASMTRKWCSPEVAAHLPRGRASDIFSLGCVFTQMCTVIVRKSLSDFDDFRAGGGIDDSFHSNLPRVREWVSGLWASLSDPHHDLFVHPTVKFTDLLEDMIQEQPERRPTSTEVLDRMEQLRMVTDLNRFWRKDCCKPEREAYRVAEEDEIFHAFRFKHYRYMGKGL
ncbi:kinase-like domain-containing protein [Clohesyomyces aquaticus]|uniref:Kinase-like domain-containing protein n=1 Tax=Clohesyomyces aquaticus TaxID=1231657 RepID=A0A1Y1ZKV8_9PLEO|nr:kinase-like domain-containing protein [Clohesyomyces aquaticus]